MKKNLSDPLTDEELDRLGDFLLNRISDEADEKEGFNHDIMDVSELDGFLTAIVSGPQLVPPSTWLPILWGDAEPVWDSESQFESIFSLLMRHMNGIAATLLHDPDGFEPLFNERVVNGKTYVIVDEWCSGYVRGAGITEGQWLNAEAELLQLLMPIQGYGTPRGWEVIKGMTEGQQLEVSSAIPSCARRIYQYWLGKRTPVSAPVRRASVKIGRNDACPCGSGKKYKHCCMTREN